MKILLGAILLAFSLSVQAEKPDMFRTVVSLQVSVY